MPIESACEGGELRQSGDVFVTVIRTACIFALGQFKAQTLRVVFAEESLVGGVLRRSCSGSPGGGGTVISPGCEGTLVNWE